MDRQLYNNKQEEVYKRRVTARMRYSPDSRDQIGNERSKVERVAQLVVQDDQVECEKSEEG